MQTERYMCVWGRGGDGSQELSDKVTQERLNVLSQYRTKLSESDPDIATT